MNIKTTTMKPLAKSKDKPLDIRLSLASTQTLSMETPSAMRMMMHYYPKATKHLLEKSMSRAQKDHKLELDKNYCASFEA